MPFDLIDFKIAEYLNEAKTIPNVFASAESLEMILRILRTAFSPASSLSKIPIDFKYSPVSFLFVRVLDQINICLSIQAAPPP
ncbi:hypothetical protein D3C80_1596070 [compost metagenome]